MARKQNDSIAYLIPLIATALKQGPTSTELMRCKRRRYAKNLSDQLGGRKGQKV